MTEVVWGPIAKSIEDKETVEQFIDRRFAEHNESASAHGQSGESIATHRISEIIDHATESVINSKLLYMARTYSAIVDTGGDGDFTSIQAAIDYVSGKGGGRVFVKNGTYTLAVDLTIPENIMLEGETEEGVVIDFNGTTKQIKIEGGTNGYSTGTVTINYLDTVVIGSGTSWSANVTAGEFMWLRNQWYKIETVTDDTHMTIGRTYTDSPLSGASYEIQPLKKNVILKGFTVKDSHNTGGMVSIQRTEDIILDNLTFDECYQAINIQKSNSPMLVGLEIENDDEQDVIYIHTKSYAPYITKCRIMGVATDLLRIDTVEEVLVKDNIFYGGDMGVRLNGCERFLVTGNMFEFAGFAFNIDSNSKYGIISVNYIYTEEGEGGPIAGEYMSITGNILEGVGGAGWGFTCSNSVIDGNVVSTTWAGLAISGDDNVVSNNNIGGVDKAYLVVNGDGNIVEGNRLNGVNTNLYGIRLSGANKNVVKGNYISKCTDGVILVNSDYTLIAGNYEYLCTRGVNIDDANCNRNRIHGEYARSCTTPIVDRGLNTSLADNYSI